MNNLFLNLNERIATITFDRPNSLNSLNIETLHELDKVIEDIKNNETIDIIVFTGIGKAFIAGADISEMANMNELEAKEYAKLGSKIFRKIELLRQITIASINGYCLGGGNELAMATDMRIASENAKFGQPEVSLGIIPGFSGTQRLPRLIGITKAKELLFTGKIIDANEAKMLGLVNQVVSHELLTESALNLAQTILKNSQNAIQIAKKAINEGIEAPLDDAIELENIYFSQLFSTFDQKEGMAAFLEKRKANFRKEE